MSGLKDVHTNPVKAGNLLIIQMEEFGASAVFMRGASLEEVVLELENLARRLINQSNITHGKEPLYVEIKYSGFYYKREQETESGCTCSGGDDHLGDGNPCGKGCQCRGSKPDPGDPGQPTGNLGEDAPGAEE